MSGAARLIALGLAFILGGVALLPMVDWPELWRAHPGYRSAISKAVYGMLVAAAIWGMAVPGMLLAASGYRFAVARSGRGFIAWKLFAYVTLWALISFACYFGLFLAYAGGGGPVLLVPSLLACLGYIVLGLGFVLSTLRPG